MRGAQRDRALRTLALGDALVRHLDAVVEAVAHQMGQRIADLLDQPLVQLGTFTDGLELHLLVHLAGEIAHHAREAAEHEIDRHHAHRHHRFLQVAGVALQLCETIQQAFVNHRIETRSRFRQHRLGDHQLADEVDHLVDLLDADADRGLGRPVGRAAMRRLALRQLTGAGHRRDGFGSLRRHLGEETVTLCILGLRLDLFRLDEKTESLLILDGCLELIRFDEKAVAVPVYRRCHIASRRDRQLLGFEEERKDVAQFRFARPGGQRQRNGVFGYLLIFDLAEIAEVFQQVSELRLRREDGWCFGEAYLVGMLRRWHGRNRLGRCDRCGGEPDCAARIAG